MVATSGFGYSTTTTIWDESRKGTNGREGVLIKDHVTCVDWNFDGSLLGTGSRRGVARIWDTNGNLINTLGEERKWNECPIYYLTWNKKGLEQASLTNYILIASYRKINVWDAVSAECKQSISIFSTTSHHRIIEVDWQTHQSFAISTCDMCIRVFKLGSEKPIKIFSGEQNIWSIEWDPSAQLLASLQRSWDPSESKINIWNMKNDSLMHSLSVNDELDTFAWSPTIFWANITPILASGSEDGTIRLWNIDRGECIRILSKHSSAIWSVAFSPDGKYLASGSSDKCVHIWITQTGQLLHTHRDKGTISRVSWNFRGDKVGVNPLHGDTYVVDVRNAVLFLSNVTKSYDNRRFGFRQISSI